MSVRIPAADWNELLTDMVPLLRNRIMSVTAAGKDRRWRHPWWTGVRWDNVAKSWLATVKPGLVNGQDVTVSVMVDEVKKDVPLTEDPAFPLGNFRSIGTDTISIDGAGESVPEFFRALGVKNPRAISTELGDGLTETITGLPDAGTESLPPRQLRACDIVLRCHRPRTSIDWLISAAETGSTAQVSLLTTGSSSHKATLHVTAKFSPIQPTDEITRLAGAVNDPGYDEAHVCTVYLLSPENAGPEAEIDETWQPYVEHQLFWNTDYLTTAPPSLVPRQNIEVNLAGLGNAAGAQLTINQILSTQNDDINNAITFLLANQITGKITTPGHGKGAVEWNKAESLDPEFPFFGLR